MFGPKSAEFPPNCDMISCAIMQSAVQVENLTKRFGTFTAVDGVTFAVKRGEVFGILGPNGAGTVSYTHLTLPTTPYV